jgi:hypothetical protein
MCHALLHLGGPYLGLSCCEQVLHAVSLGWAPLRSFYNSEITFSVLTLKSAAIQPLNDSAVFLPSNSEFEMNNETKHVTN